MKKVDTNIMLQFIGLIGVFSGLIFVGLELRQAHQIALAEQMNNRLNVLMSLTNAYIESNLDFYSAMVNQHENDALFSDAEKGARNMLNAQWALHENDYFQYNAGLMTEELWQAKLFATRNDLLKCEHQDIYDWRISLVQAGFREILEEMRLLNPCEN